MLYALLVALVAVNAAYLFANDRKDRRHHAQVDRLLLAQTDPEVLRVAPEYDGPLYRNTGDTDRLPEKVED